MLGLLGLSLLTLGDIIRHVSLSHSFHGIHRNWMAFTFSYFDILHIHICLCMPWYIISFKFNHLFYILYLIFISFSGIVGFKNIYILILLLYSGYYDITMNCIVVSLHDAVNADIKLYNILCRKIFWYIFTIRSCAWPFDYSQNIFHSAYFVPWIKGCHFVCNWCCANNQFWEVHIIWLCFCRFLSIY